MSEMKQYMLLIGGTGEGMAEMSEEAVGAHMQQWDTWFENLGKEGILLGGAPFSPDSMLVTGKEKAIKAGYWAGSKENAYGGYVLIQAGSVEHAAEITKGCPTFELDGTIEIREITQM